jgi:beta-lactamase regulating signal transducer with metallopeptidase domain
LLAGDMLAVWLAGCSILVLIGLRGWCRLARLVREAAATAPATSPPDRQWVSAEVGRLAARMKVASVPRVVWAARNSGVRAPFVAGLARPVIVLPHDFDRVLSPDERRLALAHELAHLRRGDLWLGCCRLWPASFFSFSRLPFGRSRNGAWRAKRRPTCWPCA